MSHSLPYRDAGLFLIRVPALPQRVVTDVLAASPAEDRRAVPERRHSQHQALIGLWLRTDVAGPIRETSPDLAAALDRIGDLTEPDQRRALRALFRYVARMSSPPAPFGRLAGVAIGRFADVADLRLSGNRRAVDSIDADWARALWTRIDGFTEGIPACLPLVANSLLRAEHASLWLECNGAAAGSAPATVMVPATGVVTAALRHAQAETSAGELIRRLAAEYPGADPADVATLLTELTRLGLLVRPTRAAWVPGRPDPVALLAELSADADEAAQLAEAAQVLRQLAVRPDERAGLRERLNEIAARLTPHYRGPALHTDTVVEFAAPPRLPAAAGVLACQAAAALTDLGTAFCYPGHLRRYASAFITRYGTGAEIPVLEVMSATAGIGLPDGYDRHPSTRPLASPDRDECLSRLLAQALSRRDLEVRLSGAGYDALAKASGGADARPTMPALDVNLQLLAAAAPSAPLAGVVSGVGVSPAGRAFGRFLPLFDPATVAGLTELTHLEEGNSADCDYVELGYPVSGGANAAARGTARQWELPVNTTSLDGSRAVLTAAEVLLGLRESRFYFRSAKTGRPLLFTQSSMIDPDKQAAFPRFLMDVSISHFRYAPRFDWGALEQGPFLPRVTVDGPAGAVVLRRAEWRLGLGELAGRPGAGVAAWRRDWMVPRWVHLLAASGQLLLDLDSAISLAELSDSLRAAGDQVRLAEALPAPDAAESIVTDPAGQGYVCDVVVPVVSRRGAAAPATAVPRQAAVLADPASHAVRGQRFGSDWLSLHVQADPAVHDQLLTGEVAALLRALVGQGVISHYHFVRFPEPSWHLRIRLRAAGSAAVPELYLAAARWCRAFAADGRIGDITATTYRRELERYGGPDAIGLAEDLFTIDSALVLAALAVPTGLSRGCATAITLERLARPLITGCRARRDFVGRPVAGAADYRSAQASLWRAALSADADGLVPAGLERDWAACAQEYTRKVTPGSPDGDSAIRGLLHMHCNRMGLSRALEETTYGIWSRMLGRCAAERPSHRMCSAGVRP